MTARAVPPERGGTSWRLAARLARREVRRRPGRTVLVMLLVALPVVGMTMGSVLFRTGHDSYTERFRRTNGAADLASHEFRGDDAGLAERASLLPAGSRVVRVHDAHVPVKPADAELGRRFVELTDLPMDDPMTRGIVEIVDGRAPRAGEVLLSSQLARQLGVEIGSTLRLAQPDLSARVAGIGRRAEDFDAPVFVAPGFDFSIVRPEYASERLLVDLPAGMVPSRVVAGIDDRSTTFEAADKNLVDGGDEDSVRPLAWGWVSGVLLLAVMGVIITAAFATSARRQLVTLGQLSANGADERLLRRALSLQGSWSGLLGSVVGVAVAVGGLVVFRSMVEEIIHHDPGTYVLMLSDLAVIALTGIGAATVAAFVPARTITRVPVLSALGGRRPLGAVPKRLVPTGLALFGGGVALLVLVAAGSRGGTGSGDLFAAAAVIGGLAVLGGVSCISPILVGSFGPVASRVGGAPRLAARSLARVRTRSAAVVTAIAVAGAVAVAASTFLGMTVREPRNQVFFPDDVLTINGYNSAPSGGGFGAVPVPDATRASVAAIVPGIQLSPIRHAALQAIPVPATLLTTQRLRSLTVADPPMLATIGLSDRDAATLARTGVLELDQIDPDQPRAPGPVHLQTGTGVRYDAAVRADEPASRAGGVELLVTPQRATELGLVVSSAGLLGRAPEPLTESQRAALFELNGDPFFSPFVGQEETQTVGATVSFESSSTTVSRSTIQLAIAGGALAFTLLVVAIGLALSAAESREERDVLVAVGARPRTLRRVAGLKAVALALAGALLAIPTGFVPVTLVVRAATAAGTIQKPVTFPWTTAALLLLAIPLIAGLVTFLATRVAQLTRPLQMSTIAVD